MGFIYLDLGENDPGNGRNNFEVGVLHLEKGENDPGEGLGVPHLQAMPGGADPSLQPPQRNRESCPRRAEQVLGAW